MHHTLNAIGRAPKAFLLKLNHLVHEARALHTDQISLRHTHTEWADGNGWYTPNPWIGGALSAVLLGRLIARRDPTTAIAFGQTMLGSLPVFGVAAAQSYESFLFFRLAIGAIGASFVITQYHTSVMFAPNVVGTANAAAAGWGNAGGGATQALMPLLLAALVLLGVEQAMGWRIALLVPGLLMLVCALLYWRYTQDCPAGDYEALRAAGQLPGSDERFAGSLYSPEVKAALHAELSKVFPERTTAEWCEVLRNAGQLDRHAWCDLGRLDDNGSLIEPMGMIG